MSIDRDVASDAEIMRDAKLYRGVLEVIAESYPDVPFEEGEMTPYGKPTNRAVARAALATTHALTQLGAV